MLARCDRGERERTRKKTTKCSREVWFLALLFVLHVDLLNDFNLVCAPLFAFIWIRVHSLHDAFGKDYTA